MQPRLKDIAQRAGVSVQAVSAVLSPARSTSNVSEQTRDRVLHIARQLGYVPNAVAASLVRGSSATVGLTCFNLRDRHFLIAIDAAERRCAENGHVLLVSTPRQAPDWAARLRDGRVDYLLVIAMELLETTGQHIPPALQSRVTVVGPSSKGILGPKRQWGALLSWDDFAGGALAAEHLLRHGCRCIGVLAGRESNAAKIKGAVRTLNNTDVEHHLIDIDLEPDMARAGADMTDRLIDQCGDRLDGVLLRNDQFYPGVIDTLGRRLGDRASQVEIVGYFGFYSCIASVRTPIREAVEYALQAYFTGGPHAVEDRQFDVVLRPKATAQGDRL